MKFDPRTSRLAAWLNIIATIITIAGLLSYVTEISFLEPLKHLVPVPAWLLLVGFVFIPTITILISRLLPKNSDTRLATLHKHISNPDVLNIIGTNGKECLGGHAGNFTWKEIATSICKIMELSNLRYSNLGTQYHLQDIANGKIIQIPTDNCLEEKVTKSGVRNGQILLVVENS